MAKKFFLVVVLVAFLVLPVNSIFCVGADGVKIGSEMLMDKYHHLIEGKKIGLVTNQSGVNSRKESTIDLLANDRSTSLVALFGPEHGIDGKAKAGEYVKSYTHEKLGIPVYSLYGQTRMPTGEMLKGLDAIVFDVQDIGARTYTYISTLNYCLVAAQKYDKTVIVLDRPNPLGGNIVEGPVLEDKYTTFVGVDNLPMAHGMTIGELAQFFNRKIGADLKVVPMEGYKRPMLFPDTGLTWVQTSPNIPDLDSVYGYMATGLGEGTGIFQADKFKWIGGKGLNAEKYAGILNKAGLPGVTFVPEQRGEAGGVRLKITDPYTFNPARTGIYALAYAYMLGDFTVPKSNKDMVMFDKVMGTNKIGEYLEQGLSPQQIEKNYAPALEKFKEERKKYLISDYELGPDDFTVLVEGRKVAFDSSPYIDKSDRLMVPLRAIAEALGATVGWEPQTRTVTITGARGKIVFTIGSSSVLVDGKPKVMDTVPVIKNDRTMVPVRYVGEYLKADVHWNAPLKTVTVNARSK
ncbi:MAG: DUF1343 domain-containing protein [Firmicutes bacterium]|nr:DUF1343 domain-containing protein [Bacillota bacterium]